VPRPALAAKLSAPNPCTGCHAAKSAAWAEEEIRKRHPAPASATPTWGQAFLLAREEKAGAAAALSAVFGDTHLSTIVRASALHALTAYPSAELATLLRTAASDADPLMRRTAADVAASLPPAERPAVVWPLLKDPARSARIAAAQALLELPPGNLGAGERTTLASAVAEYVAALEHNADRAEALADLAELARRDGRSDEAERLLTAAIRKDPSFAAAHLNLADLYRERGDEQRALTTLRTALEQVDERPAVRHALGLALVRQKRSQEALVELRAAHEAAPLDARFGYVYAVALFDSGSAERALEVLEALRRRRPDDAQVLRALVDYSRRSNRNEQAEKYARELGALTERR
jgi:tetratricopeptide (TPR) repeat protein